MASVLLEITECLSEQEPHLVLIILLELKASVKACMLSTEN